MYHEKTSTPHALGLEKFTGSNRGLYYANERVERIPNPNAEEGGPDTVPQYTYDVYEVSDARFPDAVKDEVIIQRYPRDEEHKILRKTLASLITELGMADKEIFAEFVSYNDFVNAVRLKQ